MFKREDQEKEKNPPIWEKCQGACSLGLTRTLKRLQSANHNHQHPVQTVLQRFALKFLLNFLVSSTQKLQLVTLLPCLSCFLIGYLLYMFKFTEACEKQVEILSHLYKKLLLVAALLTSRWLSV